MSHMSQPNESFVDFCIDLCKSDKKSILKKILKKKYERVRASDDASDCSDAAATNDIPKSGHDLLRMDPSPADFIDYTYSVCSLENHMNKEDILKATLLKDLEDLTNPGGKVATKRQHASATVADRASRRAEKKRKCVSLPKKLSKFVFRAAEGDECTETLNTMAKIIPSFFPDMSFVLPCVYSNKSFTDFLLYIPDRHVNRWAASGSQCKFTWKTPEQDDNMALFSKVVSAVPRVHVVRERKRELLYMGRCNEVQDVSSSGTCVMFVS